MELDRALGPQEPHWKEFRFDLTQIPAGEAVTAAEFRIYKLPSTHPLNRTLHVSMFEVVRERANRCLPCAQFLSSLGVCPAQPSGAHFPEDRRGASWEHTPEMRDAWPEAPAPWGEAQCQSWLQVPALPPWLWDLEWAIELPAYFPICPRHSNPSLR